jgi:tripeptidyl-peptidase-1
MSPLQDGRSSAATEAFENAHTSLQIAVSFHFNFCLSLPIPCAAFTMRFCSLTIFGALAASVAALPAPAAHVAHEKRDYLPKAWVKRSKLGASEILPVRIGLTQSNLDKGYDLLMEVSQHDSPRYGKHYTAEEVTEIFAPQQSTVDTVKEWLESSGIHADRISLSTNKQWLQFDALTYELESLLQTEYHIYQHEATGKHNVACDKYHVPEHVQEHVDYITPGIKLFATGSGKSEPSDIQKRTFGVTSGKGNGGLLPPLLGSLPIAIADLLAIPELQVCSIAITPPCVKALYNITAATKANAGNSMGIFEDLGDTYSQTDLDLFFLTLEQNIPIGTHPTLKGIDGATAPNQVTSAGPESDLDFQLAYPIIYPQTTTLFQTDDDVYQNNYVFQGFLNNFLDAIDGSYCTYSAFGETGNSVSN